MVLHTFPKWPRPSTEMQLKSSIWSVLFELQYSKKSRNTWNDIWCISIIFCTKYTTQKLREHLNYATELNKQGSKLKILYLMRAKWHNNDQWKHHQRIKGCISYNTGSDSCTEDFILVSNNSQGIVGYNTEGFVTLQVYASPDHLWPTSQSIMLDDVTGNNRQFLYLSCVLMNHQWREHSNSGGSANSGVHWKMWIVLNGAGQWAEVPLQTVDPHATLFETVSHRLVRNMHTRSPISSPVPSHTKEQIAVLLLGWCPSTAPFSSASVVAILLVSHPCSRDCARRHSTSSWVCTYGCSSNWNPCTTWLGCRSWFMLTVVKGH